MDILGVASVLPVDNLKAAVAAWSALLGVAPTFVDGDGWAQFDVAGKRIALAGTDRASDKAGVMIKVGDLTAARETAVAQGLAAGPIQEGAHELRCTVSGPGGWPIVLYAPKPK
jgi:hypothetical protein